MEPYGSKTYNITAALPYANGSLHIGHLAGAYLPADIYARYLRMRGHRVIYICGSDEGGVAILLRARKHGVSPQAIVDKFHQENKTVFKALGISFDAFERTSSPLHHKLAAEFFTTLHQKGVLQPKESEQFYDVAQQTFLADRYLQGKCPHCGFQDAYGDQCESCGRDLSPEELIAPTSKLSGDTPIRKKTTHWYFHLENHAQWLQKWLSGKKNWKPNVYGQCLSWLAQGLRSRAMTRDLDWGVPVPLKQAAGKVLYVWFEAPIGYISATQAWAKQHGQDWRPFWQDPNTQLVHFIGKDNIVFHCLLFPSMLKAHGGYILPHYVCANEFMHLEGQKISTSRNHAVWLKDYLQNYPNQQDILRYVLAANLPETKDSHFRWDTFKYHHNQELVGILGNFVHRVLVLVHKYMQGRVPSPHSFTAIDQHIIATVKKIPLQIGDAIEAFKFKKGLALIIDMARAGNKYLTDTAPWHTIKNDKQQAANTLYICLQIIAKLACYMSPYLPFTSQKLASILPINVNAWHDNQPFEHIPPDTPINAPQLLFTKLT